MRTPISEAPEAVRSKYQAILKGSTVTEADAMLAIEFAVAEGYMPERPATPIYDRVQAAITSGDLGSANAIRYHSSWALMQEERALTRWVGLRNWAKGPSKAEEAKARAAERARVAQEAEIENRTAQILIADQEAAVARARERARAEVAAAIASAAGLEPALRAEPTPEPAKKRGRG